MVDEVERQPDGKRAEAQDVGEVEIAWEETESTRERAFPAPPRNPAWKFSGVAAIIGPRTRPFILATVGVCVLGVVALALAQGLTAALRSSLPTRVAGITDPGGGQVSIAIEPSPSLTAGIPAPAEKPRPVDAKVADVRDLAEASRPVDGIRVVPEKTQGSEDYLPEHDRTPATQTSGTQIVVPASQGRLLRFDEPVESVFIADPTIADIRVVSPELVYVYGKAIGRTNLMAVSNRPADGEAGPKLTGSALLRVIADAGPADEAKKILSPDAPSDVVIFGRRAVIVGSANNIDQAVSMANIAETFTPEGQPPINDSELQGSNQINIRVRFAEVSRNDLKSFGIDWNIAVSAGNFSFGLQRTTQTLPNGLNPNIELGVGAGNFDIDLLIEALQANGALTVLAEPNLTAVTGETASFLAGGEVPIPVPSSEDRETLSGITYKPFGVSLAFTPTLVKHNRIGLRVKPEVSSISATADFAFQGFNLPTFTVRRAETVVEVASGQTFAIAGLFQREVSRSVEKLPVLGDVPVLGPLFRSDRYQRNETELVILITPYLVQPVSDRRVATPLDRMEATPSWRADVIGPDATSKGAALTSEDQNAAGFIMK